MFYTQYIRSYLKLYKASHQSNPSSSLMCLALNDLQLDQRLTLQLLLENDRFYNKLIITSSHTANAARFLHHIFIELAKQNPDYVSELIFNRRYLDIFLRDLNCAHYLCDIAVYCKPFALAVLNFTNKNHPIGKEIYIQIFQSAKDFTHLDCVEHLQKIMMANKEITKQIFAQKTSEAKELSDRLLNHPNAWEIINEIATCHGIKKIFLTAVKNKKLFDQKSSAEKSKIFFNILLKHHLNGSPNPYIRPKTIIDRQELWYAQ